jgi:SynChlorMet cassette protein ScmD
MTYHEEMTPAVKPSIVLREEFDDWAILFDPDLNTTFGINPIGVIIWKCIDGRRTMMDIMEMLYKELADVPEDAGTHLKEFIDDLVKRGLASYTNL